MTYKEIVEKVKKEFCKADASQYQDHLALQINITGEGEGAFYTEINEGKISVEPYDYTDNNAMITASADDIIKIFSGKLDMNEAAESGQLSIVGDYAKALSIQPVINGNKKTARKTATKKTTTKKSTTKKSTKTSEKAEAKTTTKTIKETAAKTTATKTAAKKTSRTAKKG